MARLGAAATGNLTAAGTWGVCDTTAAWVIDSETTTLNVTTSTSAHISPSATPGAITVDGVYLKLYLRASSPTGTFTVVLRNTTLGSDVTSVVVNVSDLKVGGGWHFFKFGSSQLLLAATAYAIRVTCSVSVEVILYRSNASAQEFSRLIRTTTTGAPAAGDQMIISNEFLSAGSSNAITVTMDNTASTVFGSTSYIDSIAISGGGTLTWGTSGSTNYLLTVAGVLSIWANWNRGTSGGRMPSSSTARLVFSVASNVDSGLKMKPGLTYNDYGNLVTADNTLLTVSVGGYCTTAGTTVTRVSGQSFTGLTGTIRINGVNYTISSVTNANTLVLTGSAGTQSSPVVYTHAGTANVITVGSTSGMAANDIGVIASTNRTAADSEQFTIQSVDSPTQLTLTTALTNQHSGDSPTQAEIIHLTRNVTIEGTSSSLQGYVLAGDWFNGFQLTSGSSVNFSYVEFKYLGSGTAAKRGIDVGVTTGNFTMIGCTIHDFVVTGSSGLGIFDANSNNISVTYTHFWNIHTNAISHSGTSGTSITFDHLIGIKNVSSNFFNFNDMGCVITNITAVSSAGAGIAIGESGLITGTISGLVTHSNSNNGLQIGSALQGGNISSCSIWRNSGLTGLSLSGAIEGVYIDNLTVFGNANFNVSSSSSWIYISNAIVASDILFTSIGVNCIGFMTFVNSTFGVVSGILRAHTSDLQTSNGSSLTRVLLKNCTLASATEISSQTSMSVNSWVKSQKHDQTTGLHKRWERYGTAVIDTSTYKTASPAETLTPNNATYKFRSSDTQPIAIDNGQTATVSVYVYKSASYNGNQPRLILRRNDAIGITSDTVLGTASGGTGTWILISGTTGTVTDDGAFVCYVDCDGTAGTVTVDDWSIS